MFWRNAALALGMLLLGLAPAHAQKRIALTFDDAPRSRGAFLTPEQRTTMLIAGLRKARVRQAAFFVNAGNLATPDGQGGEARLMRYVAAGHVLANHSFSHPHLGGPDGLTAEAYLANVDKGQAWLEGRPGYRPWFRFPFLDEGGTDKAKRDALRAGLAARGIQNGYVTADGGDWHMESLTIDAVKAGRKIDRKALRDLYIETHVQAADAFDAVARKAIGRSPAHVMLMHETDLAALYLPALVAALRADGWEIIPVDEAYWDPIHTAMPDTPSANGTLTEALAWAKGVPEPRWYVRNNTTVAKKLFDERVLHEKAAP